MDAVISVTARTGFTLIRHYFCKHVDSEDLTNKQIVEIFQDKIDKVQKDLETLKLQKLRSAAYLFKCGVSMFEENDLEEAKHNFEKAESDAIEGFSTAPDIDWKELSVKISISAHIWRRLILVESPNIDAVIKQVVLHLQRLSGDEIIKSNVGTHLEPSYNFMRKINENKRKDIITRFIDLHQQCKKILFENFLEILPSIIIEYRQGRMVTSKALATPYAQGSSQNDIVPYSPNQCKLFPSSPIIAAWRNVKVECAEGMVIMVAHGVSSSDTLLYQCHRMSYELPGSVHPPGKWFVYPVYHSAEFEIVFASVNIKYTVVRTPLSAKLVVSEEEFPLLPDYRDASHVRAWIDLQEEYFRGDKFVKCIREEGVDKVVLALSVAEVVDVASLTLSLHLRRRNMKSKGFSGLVNLL